MLLIIQALSIVPLADPMAVLLLKIKFLQFQQILMQANLGEDRTVKI